MSVSERRLKASLRIVAAMAVLALGGCGSVALDPTDHHIFARETGAIVQPPEGLLHGTAK
jgi:hypothetical protein